MTAIRLIKNKSVAEEIRNTRSKLASSAIPVTGDHLISGGVSSRDSRDLYSTTGFFTCTHMVPLRLLKPVKVYAHAMILAHLIGLPLTALLSGRLGMSWRAPGLCLSTPGCQLPTGLTPAVAFVIMRIYAWWKVKVLGIDAASKDILNEKSYHSGH